MFEDLLENLRLEESTPQMMIGEALEEWQSKNRRLGCIAASKWFVKRVPGFSLLEITRYCEDGESYGHVVVTNGRIRIDLAPEYDGPDTKYETESAAKAKGKIDYK